MRQVLSSIAFAIFGTVFALLLLEGGFRLVETRLRPQTWNDRPPFYFQHELSPTLQDYPYAAQKPEQTFRIAVIGDSFTFAPYMQFTDAFPKQLERMLNLNSTPRRVEVLDYGVPGYSTNHEVAKVEQAIKEQADLIMMQVTLNDPEIKHHIPIGITDFSNFGPIRPTGFEALIFKHFHIYRFIAERLHNSRTHRDYKKYFLHLYEDPRSWGLFVRSWEKIAQLARNHNVKLVAVVFPLFGLELDENYPFYSIHEKIDKLLSDLSIPHTDLSIYYKGIPLQRLQVMPGIDRHPNEIGHRIAAERIYIWLAHNNFIPDEFKIKLRFKDRTRIIKEEPYTGE